MTKEIVFSHSINANTVDVGRIVYWFYLLFQGFNLGNGNPLAECFSYQIFYLIASFNTIIFTFIGGPSIKPQSISCTKYIGKLCRVNSIIDVFHCILYTLLYSVNPVWFFAWLWNHFQIKIISICIIFNGIIKL